MVVGLNSTSKLLNPFGFAGLIGVEGNDDMEKSPTSPLTTVTPVMFRFWVPPKFSILKVLVLVPNTGTFPKSVPSKAIGVTSPLEISGKLAVVPSTLISGPTGVQGEIKEFIPGEPPLMTSQ